MIDLSETGDCNYANGELNMALGSLECYGNDVCMVKGVQTALAWDAAALSFGNKSRPRILQKDMVCESRSVDCGKDFLQMHWEASTCTV